MKTCLTIFMAGFTFISLLTAQSGTWEQIDRFYEDKEFDASYDLLAPLAADHASTAPYLWRMSRHHFGLSDNSSMDEFISDNLYKGFEYAQQAVAADSNSAGARGYYGIIIGRIGLIEGTRQKIINSYEVRSHTLAAIKLDSENDAWQHVMGRWHYALADLSWLERTVASLIYAKPPQASFDMAVEFFLAAANSAPDEIRHLLWLGK